MPKVIFRLKNGELAFAGDLMKIARPSSQKIEQTLKKIKKDNRFPPPSLWD
jgi:hypothetical protein